MQPVVTRLRVASLLLAVSAVALAIYFILIIRAGGQVYGVSEVYGPLSSVPALGYLGSLALVTALIAAYSYSRDSRREIAAAGLIASVIAVTLVRFLLPDLAERYYITDFEDSFNHMYRAMYIAEFGHLTPYSDFMWLNRSFWLTLAESILVLWGHPGWFKDPPFYFVIKWYPELTALLMAPPTYLLARAAGLGRRASGLAVALSVALWPEFPVTASDHYGTVTFTAALALFLLAVRENDRRLLVPLLLSTLAAVYTHELVAALAGVALFGGSAALLLFPGDHFARKGVATALGVAVAAYLIMAVYDSYGFVQSGINYYWNTAISTMRRLATQAPSVIGQATVRALPAYHIAVEVKAATYIAELVTPFALSLALAVSRPSHRLLFGAVGLSGLLGAALTLGLGAVGWADRVPVMFVGVAAVIVASLAEVRGHRRAAAAAFVATVIALSPLTLYASFAGYPAVAFPEVGWDLGVWWVVTESGSPALY
ncbi:MAG: hypothetical protein ACP5HK_07500, partial [Acidilobus sp.]